MSFSPAERLHADEFIAELRKMDVRPGGLVLWTGRRRLTLEDIIHEIDQETEEGKRLLELDCAAQERVRELFKK